MGRVFHTKFRDRKTGEIRETPNWYAEWQGADGNTHRKKVGPRKQEANEFLAKMEARENRIRLGLDPAPMASADRTKPLTKLLTEYLEVLEAKATSPEYRDLVKDYLGRTFSACEWLTWEDINSNSLLRFLGRRRNGEGVKIGRRPGRGNGPATLNSYMRTAKGFCNWLAEKMDVQSPLRKLKPFAEEVDRRRSKRILTDPELTALLEATARGKRSGRQILSGRDRAMLYRIAAYTGLRAGELGELLPRDFHLDAAHPVVTVLACDAKGKREEPVPIPSHLVESLREWLKLKLPDRPVWPGNWAQNGGQVSWLKTDLGNAGVAEFDDRGRRVTFHSLKRRYVVRLIQTGAAIHEVRRLARHRDVQTTLNYYTDTDIPGLAAAADRLPPTG